MKKAIRKLVVRGEILRTLRTLDNSDLIRAVGGDAAAETGAATCPGPAMAATTFG